MHGDHTTQIIAQHALEYIPERCDDGHGSKTAYAVRRDDLLDHLYRHAGLNIGPVKLTRRLGQLGYHACRVNGSDGKLHVAYYRDPHIAVFDPYQVTWVRSGPPPAPTENAEHVHWDNLAHFALRHVPVRWTGGYAMAPAETAPRDTLIQQLRDELGIHMTRERFTRHIKKLGYHKRQVRGADNTHYIAIYRSPDTPVYHPEHEVWTTAVD